MFQKVQIFRFGLDSDSEIHEISSLSFLLSAMRFIIFTLNNGVNKYFEVYIKHRSFRE